MKVALLTVALALAAASPAGAQARGCMNMADPDHAVNGTGQLPAGWTMRFDPARAGCPESKVSEVNFVTMGSGYHFTTSKGALYYRDADRVSGEYTVTATFSQRKSVGHEAYGIFIGGSNLQDSTQNYLYFVVKPCRSSGTCPGDGAPMGEILISRRSSNARPTPIVPITHHDAVVTDDPADGHATNKIAIRVAKDSVHFMLNDKPVRSVAKSALNGASTDGIVGLRINHNIDVHVGDYAIKKS